MYLSVDEGKKKRRFMLFADEQLIKIHLWKLWIYSLGS